MAENESQASIAKSYGVHPIPEYNIFNVQSE